MSHQQNQYNNRTYEDCQDYLYERHEVLHEITARIGSIYNILIRSSSTLLYSHTYTPNEMQTNKFAIARRTFNKLNSSASQREL